MRRWIGAVTTVALLAAALATATHGATRFARTPIEVVRIEGNLTDAQQSQVRRVVLETLREAADVDAVVERLNALGWSRDVRVRRVWPNAIYVQLAHETLAARWGSDAYLTTGGEVVRLPAPPRESLPLLSGALSEPVVAMQTFQVLDESLKAAGLTLRALFENPLGEWHMELENGLQVVLGERDLKLRLERFLVVYDRALSDRLDRVERVDARYEGGVAVRWRREEGQMVATSNFSGG